MRTANMAEAAESAKPAGGRGVNPDYRTAMEITTRRGGIFWGLVLLLVGFLWLLGSLGYIVLNFDLLIPLLVMLAGVYLLVAKLLR